MVAPAAVAADVQTAPAAVVAPAAVDAPAATAAAAGQPWPLHGRAATAAAPHSNLFGPCLGAQAIAAPVAVPTDAAPVAAAAAVAAVAENRPAVFDLADQAAAAAAVPVPVAAAAAAAAEQQLP